MGFRNQRIKLLEKNNFRIKNNYHILQMISEYKEQVYI
jgi:hypothetical protein